MELSLQYSLKGNEIIDPNNPTSYFKKWEYHIVPEEVALVDDNGCWCITDAQGNRVSKWFLISDNLQTFKKSKSPLNDKMGGSLALGDIVAFSNGNVDLCIGWVQRFTDKMIDIHHFYGGGHLKPKECVLKVHEKLWDSTE